MGESCPVRSGVTRDEPCDVTVGLGLGLDKRIPSHDMVVFMPLFRKILK